MLDPSTQQRLNENWQTVRNAVADAAVKQGRDPDSVQIVGVSKYVDTETTIGLVHAGCRHLGESRPQSLWQKAESGEFDSDVHWHLIGHLQRNKVRRTIRQQPLIHSIDSERLLRAVAQESVELAQQTRVLLEVNISGDQAKTGLTAEQAMDLINMVPIDGIRVVGLMAMAGWGTDADHAKIQFERTRQLRDRMEQQSGHALAELSMGMSGDYVEAIAAGATLVRIGSRLFEGVMDRG